MAKSYTGTVSGAKIKRWTTSPESNGLKGIISRFWESGISTIGSYATFTPTVLRSISRIRSLPRKIKPGRKKKLANFKLKY